MASGFSPSDRKWLAAPPPHHTTVAQPLPVRWGGGRRRLFRARQHEVGYLPASRWAGPLRPWVECPQPRGKAPTVRVEVSALTSLKLSTVSGGHSWGRRIPRFRDTQTAGVLFRHLCCVGLETVQTAITDTITTSLLKAKYHSQHIPTQIAARKICGILNGTRTPKLVQHYYALSFFYTL